MHPSFASVASSLSSASNRNPRSDYVPPCFSGHSLVELESGNTKAMSQLEVGDRILSADASGQLSFDDVIFLPHGRNSIVADFVSVTAESGKQVHATPIHLFRMCDGGLSMASDLRAGSCIRTVDGDEILSLIEKIADSDAGVYTAVVARNEFIVVDGFVASPFATAPIGHWAVHRLYHIHRLLYWLMPTVMKNLPTTVVATNSILGAGLSLALDTVLKSSSSTTGSL